MDSSFYKKNNMKYNLYPQTKKCFEIFSKLFISKHKYNIIKKNLSEIISKIFNTEKEDIYYFSSASEALEEILKILKQTSKIKRVYIPSFSCMELADAICRSNCDLKVYDIENNLKPSLNTLVEIGADRNGVLILPSLFGKNVYSKSFLDILSKLTIPVILDEAQSFPNISTKLHIHLKKYATIISFGKSKPIAGIGGGAFINNNLIPNLIVKDMKKNIKEDTYIQDIFKEILERFNNILIEHNLRKNNKTMYRSLEDLVLNKSDNNIKTENISKLQIVMAYYNIKKYRKVYLRRNIKNQISMELFGDKNIIDYNFLPLKVDNTRRYTTMKLLADKGIQSTIYYYPLNLIPYYTNKFDLEECKNSQKIFEDVIIVPFGIYYSNKKINQIIKIINNLKRKDCI